MTRRCRSRRHPRRVVQLQQGRLPPAVAAVEEMMEDDDASFPWDIQWDWYDRLLADEATDGDDLESLVSLCV